MVKKHRWEEGFSLLETLIATVIMAGAFVSIMGILPLSATMHQNAQEKTTALSLAQNQMEFFLSNPGPLPGTTGTKDNFFNADRFPPGYSGQYSASSFQPSPGLTLIVVSVTPPHSPKVELSAIDTTFSNVW